MLLGEMADGIGCGGIASEQKRLAAAAAEIDLATRAARAGFSHPFRSPKRLERGRILPDIRQ
jgi:hypothetical protein